MKCTRCGKEHSVLLYVEGNGEYAYICGKCGYALRSHRQKYPHDEIKRLSQAGWSKKRIAEKYNTNTLTIANILEEK